MYYKIKPVYNGTFTVSFSGSGNAHLPRVENIPSYVFLIIDDNDDAVLVDTGFRMDWIAGNHSTGIREESQELMNALNDIGYPAETIKTVVQTHLHWDHAAGMDFFPNAEFYLQAQELIGLLNLNPNEETYYIPGHWIHLFPRINLVNGTYRLKDGITLMFTGGHSPGHQVVAVETRSGTVILGGDAPFNYDTLWQMIPADYWMMYRNGPGKRFYWEENIIPAISGFLESRNLLHSERPVPVTQLELKQTGRCLFSHDPGLNRIEAII